MANTYTQLYIHVIFAVKDRGSLIRNEWRNDLYKYISGACINRKDNVIAIGGTCNHIHMLIGLNPSESISQLVQTIKIQTSRWINDNFLRGDFKWQSGYAAFSYSKSMIPSVKSYIDNQESHHAKKSFHDELIKILDNAGVDYNPDYIMNDI